VSYWLKGANTLFYENMKVKSANENYN